MAVAKPLNNALKSAVQASKEADWAWGYGGVVSDNIFLLFVLGSVASIGLVVMSMRRKATFASNTDHIA